MRQGRKLTGGRYKRSRKKKLHELPRQPRTTKLRERKLKKIRARGGAIKTTLLSEKSVNLSTKKGVVRTEILNVLETPQNVFLARQNILLKGAIVETPLGKARITNRPGQEPMVNAVLLEEKD
ncbi:30S ribosomal protein S8e [Candidatus Pacearchaeota archaeon]|nr:MAG: 30S ribosomal protein S8e [Candidatus Pacearchaeota archaeon]